MNKKDIFLLGGGLIAGYLICKMMNQTSSSENFSANGERAYGGKKFKWNGSGQSLLKRSTFDRQILPSNIANSSFELTGVSKTLTNQILPNGDVVENRWVVSTSGRGVKYVESNLSFTKTLGNNSFTSRVWFPKDSVIEI